MYAVKVWERRQICMVGVGGGAFFVRKRKRRKKYAVPEKKVGVEERGSKLGSDHPKILQGIADV